MTSFFIPSLASVYAQLTNFANLGNFWSLFDTVFGSSYDLTTAVKFKSLWQSGNFSQFPQIEVVSNSVLGTANGAYAISTNKIYLSDSFISTASQQSLEAVILEEFGHFVDAQVNTKDTAGDEGELFSALVRGVSLSAAELSRIKTEDDHAVIVVNGQSIAVEQAATLVGVWDRLSRANAVTVVGNYAYAVGDTLDIIDISNPGKPVAKGSYNIDYAWGVQVVGNYAYVADGYSGLQIIDITNPTSPTLKGDYYTNGGAIGVQVVGNYAYVADSYSGLQIIDISNPTSPTLNGNYDTGYAWGVQVVGNYAYVADSCSGLQIIDITNPTSPTLKGNYDTSGYANGVQVVGNYAYVADSGSGLQIIDISNPTSPTLKGNYDTSDYAIGVQVVGNYAYVADYEGGLKIIDVSEFVPEQRSLFLTPQQDIFNNEGLDDTVTGTFANLQQNDNINGGAGIDTLVITDGLTTNAVVIKASSTTNQFNITGTTINGFERFDLSGFLGKVTYTGTTTNDWVATGTGADVLNGGTGVDTLIGGLGNDTYTVDNVGDIVTETSTLATEIDAVNSSVTYTLSANVEKLTLTGTANINGTGNTLANTITGNAANNLLNGGDGNDILNGAAGIDTLIGGLGNDIYTVDNGGDIVTETSTLATEIDTVNSSVTYTLSVNVEKLTLTGTANINGTGNTSVNTITGNSGNNILDGGDGNDVLNGGAGIDTLTGGAGNDTFVVDTVTDLIDGGVGTDTIQSSVTFSLANALVSNVENLTLTGTADINGTGNGLVNTITGNTGNNILDGGTGNDILSGGTGNDTLNGGIDKDTLTGGVGIDTFVFQFGQSLVSNSDRITDFAIGTDRIDLLTQTGLAINAPTNFSRAADSIATTLQNVVNSVFTDANGAITGNQVLEVNSAALVQVTTAGIAGSYLVINDNTAGFQSNNDLLVNITGYSGTLPALGAISVNSFFV